MSNLDSTMSNKVIKSLSRSRSECEEIKLIHVWVVEKFSLRNAKIMNSSTFSSPQDKEKIWMIVMYPSGHAAEVHGFLSLFLKLTTPDKAGVKVNFSLEIQDETGTCLYREKESHTFSCGVDDDRGFGKIFKRDALKEVLPNDLLKIKCEMSYIIAENVSGTEEPECDHSVNLETLLINPKFSDVTLCVGGKDFKAHKAILASQCEFFGAMFEQEFKENSENKVLISDVKPDVFQVILTYIYTGKLAPEITNETEAKEVLAAADYFGLERLKSTAEHFLIKKLCVENGSELLLFAEKYSALILSDRATVYAAAKLNQLTS